MASSKRKNIFSGGKYEKIVGYSRAVKIDNMVFVSGTTGVMDGGSDSQNSSYNQAKCAINNIEAALKEAQCSLEDVVRNRVFCELRSRLEGSSKGA